ncbi:hypothetical protein F5Y19DRAFT_482600 [Xylariaceae sp. FL1651]|nr:hypothetical protein F5Y19DRAFT_482600 [Xylariaceae sp. FL1651]
MFNKAPASRLESLPTELLQHILGYALLRKGAFFVTVRYSSHGVLDSISPGQWLGNCFIAGPYELMHKRDWVLVNTTSRRIRGIGKELFFGTRPFAVDPRVGDLTEHFTMWQEVPSFCRADLDLARARIRTMVFRCNTYHQRANLRGLPGIYPLYVDIDNDEIMRALESKLFAERAKNDRSFLVYVPPLIAAFTRLKRCVLMPPCFYDTDTQRKTVEFTLPKEIVEFMHSAGMQKGIKLEIFVDLGPFLAKTFVSPKF